MRPTSRTLRKWYDTNLAVPPLGLAIGAALVLAVRAVSPHPGEACHSLGRTAEQWEIGLPTTRLLCAATLDGELRYARMILPEKPVTTR